jgi:hypothetical protein
MRRGVLNDWLGAAAALLCVLGLLFSVAYFTPSLTPPDVTIEEAEVDLFEPEPTPLDEDLIPPADPRERFLRERSAAGVDLVLVTAVNCRPCKTARAKVKPWAEQAGWNCEEWPIDKLTGDPGVEVGELLGVEAAPCWIGLKEGAEVGRYVGADSGELNALLQQINGNGGVDAIGIALATHLSASQDPAAGPVPYGFLRSPALRIVDLLKPFEGRSVSLGSVASFTVPRPLTWQLDRQPDALRLVFDAPPALEFQRWVFWTVEITAIRVSLESLTIELGGFPDFTCAIVW